MEAGRRVDAWRSETVDVESSGFEAAYLFLDRENRDIAQTVPFECENGTLYLEFDHNGVLVGIEALPASLLPERLLPPASNT